MKKNTLRTLFIFCILFVVNCLYSQIQFDTVPGFFRIQRELPLVELTTGDTINVSTYGALPDDGINDLRAITNALTAANASSSAIHPVRVEFDSGRYDIDTLSTLNQSIYLNNLDYILIEGNHSEIIIHNPTIGFMHFNNALNVIVQNLKIDYDKLPFTQGIVTAVNIGQKNFDLTIDSGFPSLDESYFVSSSEKWGMLKESSGKLKDGVDYLFLNNGWTKISDRVFRISQTSTGLINQFSVGDHFVQIARNNGKSVFNITSCKNITFLNVTNYASPTVSYSGYNNYEWNIVNCNIIPKDGRIQSANGDCVHSSGGYLGPWVQGCNFIGNSDDAVNLKYMSREIVSVIDSTKLRIKYDLNTNDTVCFYNPRDGEFLGEAAIESIQYLGNYEYEITLSSPVLITQTGSHQSADKLYVKTRSNESFIFRNNNISNGRRYGMQLQCSYGVVENCLFENLSGSALRIENGVDWSEGLAANNVLIKDNTFDNCGFDTDFINNPVAATITSQITKLGSPCTTGMSWCGVQTADWQGMKNIELRNNTINYNKKGLHLENINGLLLTNNAINHNLNDITGASPVDVYIDNCKMNLNIPTIRMPLDENPNASSMINLVEGSTITASPNNSGATMTSGVLDAERAKVWYINSNYTGFVHVKNTGVDYPGATGTSARTYAFWIKPDGVQFNDLLYSGTGTSVFTIQMEGGGGIRVGDNSNWRKMYDRYPQNNVWSHIAIVMFEGAGVHNIKMYLNGQESTPTNSGTNVAINTSSNLLKLFQKYKGWVSDFRYYNSALTQNEIDILYKTYNVPEAIIDLPLDENQNATSIINIVDRSSITANPNNSGATMTSGVLDDEREKVWYINSNYTGFVHVKNNGVDYPGATGTSARTYAFWIKPDGVQFNDLLYSGSGSGVFTIQMEGGGGIRVGDNTNWRKMYDMYPQSNVWSHIAIVMFDNAGVHNIKMYLNGQESTPTNTGSNIAVNTSSTLLKLFQKFKGRISDFRYYNTGMVTNQIQTIYNKEIDTYKVPMSVPGMTTDFEIPDVLSVGCNQMDPTVKEGIIYFKEPVRQIKIFSLSGCIIRRIEGAQFNSIDISDMENGLYIIQFDANVKKIIKR